MNIKNKIIQEANLLGIDKLGFTNVIKYDYLSDLLNYRVQNNFDCEFEENDIQKRLNVSHLLENCKTIITIAYPYAHGYNLPHLEYMGRISVSSYGIDYHKILHDKLERLVGKIQNYVKFNYKICVDTSPILDRAICKKTKLGYIGKNSMLINEDYGSFVFLGSIITDLDFCINNSSDIDEYTDMENKCGDCDICIKKCPNNAILEDGIINTKKCISYLTQTKEYIPIEYRKAMGVQIYGCDMCQISCPKNYKILNKKTDENYNSLLIDLEELFKISKREFDEKYKTISGSWRGKNIWKRNAIIACANMKADKFYDIIKDELYGQSDMFKIYAAWALLEIDKNRSENIIFERMKNENDKVSNEYKMLLDKEG